MSNIEREPPGPSVPPARITDGTVFSPDGVAPQKQQSTVDSDQSNDTDSFSVGLYVGQFRLPPGFTGWRRLILILPKQADGCVMSGWRKLRPTPRPPSAVPDPDGTQHLDKEVR